MFRRACCTWHPRPSTSFTRSSPQWSVNQCRRLANDANDQTREAEDDFDEHEYYELAEDVDDGLPRRRGAGPKSRNITSMGTVSTQPPHSSKIEDLVGQILPQHIGRASKPNTLPSVLLLLFTPAMAQHALSADLPLQVLQRFGDNPTASKPLETITAVVDRLPTPSAPLKGEEGIAYHFATSPGPLPTFTQVPLQSSTQKPGSLTFGFPKMMRMFDCEPAVQMPLAQTVFSTGLPSTMVHMRYEFDPLSGLLRKSASQRLEAQAVRVPIGARDLRLSMNFPLVPLTPLRRVANSMGNIVRKVSDQIYDDEHPKSKFPPSFETATPQPASQELEAAVTNYFKLNQRQPEPVQVWALIVPHDTFKAYRFRVKNPKNGLKNRSEFLKYSQAQLQDSWVPRETVEDRKVVSAKTINFELNRLIGKGARLCQVLSGGGGWGKKAGLISLDPDTLYSTRDLRAESGWAFDFDRDGVDGSFDEQKQQALGDIVREGDGIMLFLAPKGRERLSSPETKVESDDRTIVFGVLPSSIDDAHISSTADSAVGTAQSARHHPNTFGLLSEGGMALSLSRNGENVTQTRLNVPFQQAVVSNVNEIEDEDGSDTANGVSSPSSGTQIQPKKIATPTGKESEQTPPQTGAVRIRKQTSGFETDIKTYKAHGRDQFKSDAELQEREATAFVFPPKGRVRPSGDRPRTSAIPPALETGK